MNPNQIEIITLDNGLILEISDASRKVAADRWLVKLLVRIPIDITGRWPNDRKALPVPLEELRSRLGDSIEHTYQVERNFIDAAEKDMVYLQLLESIKAKVPYYSHPDFAARCILRAYTARRNMPNYP
jgi:hypothetical protein